MTKTKPIIWSYGGGKQTAAIAVLVAQKRLPRPERIVMADTGRECQTTFDYLNNYIAPLLETVGCQVEIISHDYSKQDLYYVDKEGNESDLPLMPVWTRQKNKISQLPNLCSGFWKRDAVIKWLTEPEQYYGRQKIESVDENGKPETKTFPVTQWIGFSRDEISRCKPSQRKWIKNEYPLIMGYGVSFSRDECVELVLNAGLPEPPKSRCWMCPYQTAAEWRDVKSRPEEWAKAIDLDFEIRSRDKQSAVYLHRSGTALIDADLSDKPEPLFDYAQMECSEGCWV